MDNPHRASAIAQVVFYTPTVPITLYVGIRAWKYGPRMAWYPAMAFSCFRLTGGALAIAIHSDPTNLGLIVATMVLLNIGLVPLIMPIRALTGIVLEASFPDNKLVKVFLTAIRWMLFAAVGLLSTAGGLYGHSDLANTQATLSKIAYFEFLVVFLGLVGVAVWLYFWNQHKIKEGQAIYIKWLLIASPVLFVRVLYGMISVFEATGTHLLTSIWSPMFGNAILFALMGLLPEFIVLCVYIYLGYHRFHTASRYGLTPRGGAPTKGNQVERKAPTPESVEMD